jgi:hypothetical protein
MDVVNSIPNAVADSRICHVVWAVEDEACELSLAVPASGSTAQAIGSCSLKTTVDSQ